MAILSSNVKLNNLLIHLPEAFAYHQMIIDSDGNPVDYIFVDVNPAFEIMTELKSDSIIGKKVTDVFPGIEKSAFDWIGSYGRVAATGHSICFEQYFELTKRFYHVTAYSDEPGYFAVVFRDITENKLVEEALQESEERYREILASIEDGYYEVDLAGNITYANQSAARMMGYRLDEYIGLNFRVVCKDPEEVFSKFNEVFRTRQSEDSIIMEMVHKDGSTGSGEFSVTPVLSKDGRIKGFRGVVRDVSARLQLEEKLKHLSLHDHLTGLYNRAYFEDELKRLSGSREYPMSIISIDVNGLKEVNDTMGHAMGDELIKACANALKQSLRTSDVLARVGGDEFVVLLPRTDAKTGLEIVRRMHNQVVISNRENKQLTLSIAIGIATAENETHKLDETYIEADKRMYRDKKRRKRKLGRSTG
ncbi:MAG TPA: diguanylate cyclase [Candidatus Limnocylindrales bacterium]|nr:diguanylate cyclase [Candidatus Limnocylindrales bacterium]